MKKRATYTRRCAEAAIRDVFDASRDGTQEDWDNAISDIRRLVRLVVARAKRRAKARGINVEYDPATPGPVTEGAR